MTNREHYDIDLASMSISIAFTKWCKNNYSQLYKSGKDWSKTVSDGNGGYKHESYTTEELFEIWIKLEHNDK